MRTTGSTEPHWRIEPATTARQLLTAAFLFDKPLSDGAVEEFLADPRHHLLLAVDDAEHPVGFVSGVVLVHPDKGREMFLYELGVEPASRGRGVATSLVRALAELARGSSYHGMWVLTDDDNAPALAAYRRAGATGESTHRMLEWIWT